MNALKPVCVSYTSIPVDNLNTTLVIELPNLLLNGVFSPLNLLPNNIVLSFLDTISHRLSVSLAVCCPSESNVTTTHSS